MKMKFSHLRKPVASGDKTELLFYYNKNEFGTVIRLGHKMLTKSPSNTTINHLLGSAYLMTGQAAKALPHLLIAYNPKVPLSWWNLLVAQHQSGNIRDAKELLKLAPVMDLPQAQIDLITQTVNTPSQHRMDALESLVSQNQFLEAEIAAWLFLEDYPDHPLGKEILGKLRGLI